MEVLGDIRSEKVIEDHGRSWKVMEGHGRSRNVKEGQGWSWMVFSHHRIDISGEKSYWCLGWVACRVIVSAPVSVPFLRTLDLGLGFGTWIWDLDLGLGFWTEFGLNKNSGFTINSVSGSAGLEGGCGTLEAK